MIEDGLINHIETFLGEIQLGWKCEEGLLIARFDNQPLPGAKTFVTTGLHRHLLHLDERLFRHELLMSVWKKIPDEDIVSFMHQFVCNVILHAHHPLLRSEVIGPSLPIIPGSSLTAIYATLPVLFKDDFAVFRRTTPPTVFVWLLPIHAQEADFIQNEGWSAFEDFLVEKDPDLLDMQRESVVKR